MLLQSQDFSGPQDQQPEDYVSCLKWAPNSDNMFATCIGLIRGLGKREKDKYI